MSARYQDLMDLVSPLVLVDYHTARSGDDAQVVTLTFSTREEAAAHDIDHFLVNGFINLKSCEVSKSPDRSNQWMTFVELDRRPGVFRRITAILQDLENLTGPMKWRFRVHKHPGILKSVDHLRAVVPELPGQYRKRMSRFLAQDMLVNSLLDTVEIGDDHEIIFRKGHLRLGAELIIVDRESRVVSLPVVQRAQFDPTASSSMSRGLSYMLGPEWSVTPVGDMLVLVTSTSDNAILLRCPG